LGREAFKPHRTLKDAHQVISESKKEEGVEVKEKGIVWGKGEEGVVSKSRSPKRQK